MVSKTLSEFLSPAHPAYTTTVRAGFGGYSNRVSVLSANDVSNCLRLLRRFTPDFTAEDHAELARQHTGEALHHRAQWNIVANQAAMETFGRPFQFHDYRISGIGSDEFAEDKKVLLRVHGIATGVHHRLAVLHYMAAGHRHQSAKTYCRSLGL